MEDNKNKDNNEQDSTCIFLDEKICKCTKLMRELVSNVQGAPYPGDDINKDLYYIWYEHAQQSAVECFQFLNEYFPDDEKSVIGDIDRLID